MSETTCPCCGNHKGCDSYSAQSPQFRRIAALELAAKGWRETNQLNLHACVERDKRIAAFADVFKSDDPAVAYKTVEGYRSVYEQDTKRIVELQAQLAALTEALQPFAEAAAHTTYGGVCLPDATPLILTFMESGTQRQVWREVDDDWSHEGRKPVTVKDLRIARATLTPNVTDLVERWRL